MRGRRIADQHTALGSLTKCSKKNRDPSKRRSRNGAAIEPQAVLDESHRIVYLRFTCSRSVCTKASWFNEAFDPGAKAPQTGQSLASLPQLHFSSRPVRPSKPLAISPQATTCGFAVKRDSSNVEPLWPKPPI